MKPVFKRLDKLTAKKNRAVIIAFFLILIFLFDLSRLPEDQISAKVLLFSIKQYQNYISPHLKGFVKCKFEPTCSRYGYEAVKIYGAFWGTLKTIDRLSRCSPWSDSCGYDPP